MHYLYRITNIVNNKIYIGQTNNPNLRWSQHKSSAKYKKTSQIITRALTKYGANMFTFEVIATCISQSDTDATEETLIQQYDSRNLKKGYNVAAGGNIAHNTPEILAKISKSLKKYYKTHSGCNKGKTFSEKWKRNMSIAAMGKLGTNKGKHFPNDWKMKISSSLTNKPQLSKRRFSSETESEICRLYSEENKSTYFLGKQFNCQRSLIKDILLRNNIQIRQSNYTGHNNGRNIFSQEQELNICKLYESGKFSRRDLAKQFNCGKTTIRDVLLRNNSTKGK